jgi:hypothetical protein
MKISDDTVKEAYVIAKRVYDEKLSKNAGIHHLCEQFSVNRNSATDMLNNVEHMIRGERYVRTNNAFATDHFLEMIYRDFGVNVLKNAISAVEQHLEYYEALPKGSKQWRIKKILQKYRNIASDESGTLSDEQTSLELAYSATKLCEEGYFSPATLQDERKRRLREIVERRGQPDFRSKLCVAYNDRCAVTGFDAVVALEAAHIVPYCGPQSNHVSNGLLLRGDIHILFDLDLLGIDPEKVTIVLAPLLQSSSYAELQGNQLALPTDPTNRPSHEALTKRWQRFMEVMRSNSKT